MIVGGAGALLAISGDGDGSGGSSPTPTPSPSVSSPFDPDDRQETAWGTELIRIEAPVASGKGRRVQVYFVSEGSNATMLSHARDCVTSYLEDYRAATCYAFDTEEALVYAEVADTGAMEHICWRAYVSGARNVEGTEAIEDGQYVEEGCP